MNSIESGGKAPTDWGSAIAMVSGFCASSNCVGKVVGLDGKVGLYDTKNGSPIAETLHELSGLAWDGLKIVLHNSCEENTEKGNFGIVALLMNGDTARVPLEDPDGQPTALVQERQPDGSVTLRIEGAATMGNPPLNFNQPEVRAFYEAVLDNSWQPAA